MVKKVRHSDAAGCELPAASVLGSLKPELRRSRGVYYTPEHIADYIVSKTVGRLLRDAPPGNVKSTRILDPACGAGVFLIKAYEAMLDYYAALKARELSRHRPGRGPGPTHEAGAHLTVQEKGGILTRHIFGVDIDEHAVDETRRSLISKMLEGDSGFRPGRTILPTLDGNIRCGNSLLRGNPREISRHLGREWRRFKRFDWDEEFEHVVLNDGGFDVVIGNPPWVSLKGRFRSDRYSPELIRFLLQKYGCDTYRPNIYEFFVRLAVDLLRPGGLHGFVVPDRLASNRQFRTLRRDMLRTCKIHSLAFRAPFPGVIADTLVYILEKGTAAKSWKTAVSEWNESPVTVPQHLYLNTVDSTFFSLTRSDAADLVEKVEETGWNRLSDFLNSNVGFIGKCGKVSRQRTSSMDMRVLKGENVSRYALAGSFYFEFKKANLAGGTQDAAKLGIREKILLRKTGARIIATLDESGRFPEQSLYFLHAGDKISHDLRYYLALLNSRLLNFYYTTILVTNRNATPQLKKMHLDRFPIRPIDFNLGREVRLYRDLVDLADRMLDLNKRLRKAKAQERRRIARQVTGTDREIDALVYQLYTITEKERQIVEEA